MNFTCPHCAKPLVEAERGELRRWSCESCGGTAVSLAALREERDTATLAHLWGLARSKAAAPGKACASCARAAAHVSLDLADGPLALDVCTMCQMLWLDGDELERIPKQPQRAAEPPKPLPPAAKLAYAQAMASMWRDRIRDENQRQRAADGIEQIAACLSDTLGPLVG